jgi:hypothetical protein
MPRKIKDLPGGTNLRGVAFKHPQTGETCYWRSQWGHEDGKAGVWYNKVHDADQVFTLFFDKLTDALELELVEETQPCSK